MLSPEKEAEVLATILKNRPPEKFTAKQLGSKAHWRWSRDQLLEAAVLFGAAARRSIEEQLLTHPLRDNTFNYRIRSGVTFRMAGEYERAWPILLEATTFDWDAAGISDDNHFTEWAFVEMLTVLAERKDVRGFSKLFWQAEKRCQELGAPFPRIHPKQDLLLELCDQLGLSREFAHIVERIEAQRKVTRELARRLAKLKARQLTDSEHNR